MPNRDYFLKGRNDPVLLAYEKFATDTAIKFGADPEVAKNDMRDMVDFEIKLANVSVNLCSGRLCFKSCLENYLGSMLI